MKKAERTESDREGKESANAALLKRRHDTNRRNALRQTKTKTPQPRTDEMKGTAHLLYAVQCDEMFISTTRCTFSWSALSHASKRSVEGDEAPEAEAAAEGSCAS